jgi:hypothetical protein
MPTLSPVHELCSQDDRLSSSIPLLLSCQHIILFTTILFSTFSICLPLVASLVNYTTISWWYSNYLMIRILVFVTVIVDQFGPCWFDSSKARIMLIGIFENFNVALWLVPMCSFKRGTNQQGARSKHQLHPVKNS